MPDDEKSSVTSIIFIIILDLSNSSSTNESITIGYFCINSFVDKYNVSKKSGL